MITFKTSENFSLLICKSLAWSFRFSTSEAASGAPPRSTALTPINTLMIPCCFSWIKNCNSDSEIFKFVSFDTRCSTIFNCFAKIAVLNAFYKGSLKSPKLVDCCIYFITSSDTNSLVDFWASKSFMLKSLSRIIISNCSCSSAMARDESTKSCTFDF